MFDDSDFKKNTVQVSGRYSRYAVVNLSYKVQKLLRVERMTVGKMSLAFAGSAQNGARPDKATIQKLLDENGQLIRVIVRYQNMGRANDALQYQQLLHRNLVYLASLADASIQQELTRQNDNLKMEVARQDPNSNQQNN